jgi:thiol:disulfide interchange protein DsbA
LLPITAHADTTLDEGIDFEVLPQVQPTRQKARVEVIEFFRYGCPFCDRLEPALKRWAKAHENDFVLRKVPVSFFSTTHQQLHLTLVQLNQEERLAPLIYDAIHRHARALDSLDDIVDWLSHHGMDARAFTQTWHSPAVGQAIAQANAEVQAYGVKFVPQFGVNGRYLTSPSMVGGDNARALEVVEALVKRELAERRG